jgi:hypothetical protein
MSRLSRAQRVFGRQHLLGRPAELLFPDRPGDARHRRALHLMLPFYDAKVAALDGTFERQLRACLA